MIKTGTIPVDQEVTIQLFCDNCQADIPLVFEDSHSVHEQGRGALQVIFDGGYGMFVDPIVNKGLSFLFCKSCAFKLLNTFKCFEKVLPD